MHTRKEERERWGDEKPGNLLAEHEKKERREQALGSC
jgi:hypothetical protein